MVDVPLVIGAVGDMDVDAGKSGAVSALSWYGRLKYFQFRKSTR
jgi:hypothetical protein